MKIIDVIVKLFFSTNENVKGSFITTATRSSGYIDFSTIPVHGSGPTVKDFKVIRDKVVRK
jgi:hypothetical protein